MNLKLVGSNIRKISAFRNQNFQGKAKLETNLKVINIEKVEEAKDAIKISYSFEVDYKDLGNVFLEGNLFVSGAQKDIKNILKNWKDKKIETEENILITNFILQKASLKAFQIEEELGLPIHIRLPTITLKKNKP